MPAWVPAAERLPPPCGWCWPAAPTRRCRWPGCGPAASWPSCARPTCASPPRRPPSCCGRRSGLELPGSGRGRLGEPDRRLGGRVAAGRPVAAGPQRHRLSSWRGSRAATATCWTTWPRRCWTASPSQLRTFLLETSVLERLWGPLCEAVTGRTDSQQLLEQVERANLFLVPLDEVRGWWRYHQLFADLLRARLRQERPERVPELHRAAAAGVSATGWSTTPSATRGPPATVLGRPAGRAALRRAARRREDATVRRWLAALPAELVRARPRLCLAQASGRSSAAGWRRWSRCWTMPRRRGRQPARSRTSRRSAGRRAWWRTSRRRSPGCAPSSPTCAATPRRTAAFARRPWPSWTRVTGCCAVHALAAGGGRVAGGRPA